MLIVFTKTAIVLVFFPSKMTSKWEGNGFEELTFFFSYIETRVINLQAMNLNDTTPDDSMTPVATQDEGTIPC